MADRPHPGPSTAVRVDVGAVAPAGVTSCSVEVFVPPGPPDPPVVVFCLPGGWYSRRYFDLRPAPPHTGYSMARHLAAAGVIVVTCDPPGIGDSDRPHDPFTLTPDVLADVVAEVTASVLARLRDASVGPGLAADPLVVGIGHSAGALLTVYEQARHRPFDALALLGFAGRGLVEHLTDEERSYADDPERARAAIGHLVATRFRDALPPPSPAPSTIFTGEGMPGPVKVAMRAAQDRLLALLGLTSMIPGASAPELAAVDVPVFLGVGDADITGEPRRIPGDLPNATDITLYVLAGAGHAHTIAPTRARLWDRLVRWTRSLR